MTHRTNSAIKLLCIVILSCLVRPLSAQTYSFKNYTIEDGLPQSYVQAVVQDHDGYMWLGTSDGLCKYNGVKFQIYNKLNGLNGNSISCAFRAKDSILWFGHQNGSISVFDSKKNQFVNPEFQDALKIDVRINDIYVDSTSNLYISTLGNGLIILSNNGGKYSIQKKLLPETIVFKTLYDSKGRIWMATNTGTYVLVNGNIKKIELNTDMSYSLTEDAKHNIWVGTDYKGVYILDELTILNLIDGKIEKDLTNFTKENGLAHVTVFSLYTDSKNNIWAGTYGGGVTRLTYDENKEFKAKTFAQENGIANDIIYDIMEDHEGNVWIGTLGGASVIRGGDEEFEQIHNTEIKKHLSSNQILSIEKEGNSIWVGTDFGITKVNLSSRGQIINSETFLSVKNGLKDDYTASLLLDKERGLWCGTRQGLALLPLGSKKFIALDVSSQTVTSITKDSEGNIWLGAWNGAYRYSPDTKETKHYSTENILKSDVVNKVFIDSKGNKWFATEGGLTILNQDGTSETFNTSNKLKTDNVYCIEEDIDGNIWLGTNEAGVYKFDGHNFTNFSSLDGFSSDNIYSILVDNENNIWVGTSSGIDKLDQKTKYIEHFGKAEGFLGVETNLNAAFKDEEGKLWFGTVNGLMKYNPDKDVTNKKEPLTYITGVKIFLKDTLNLEQKEISYKQNHLTFSFIGLSYTVPEKVQYQYMLEGFDKDWQPVTNKNEVTYSNIPHGSYTFKVKACNNDDVWNEKPVTYSFVITPPFWKTTWFIILCILITTGSIYLYIKIRTQKLEKAKQVLELQVAERTQEVVQQKQEIEQKNKDITDSITYARRIQLALLPHKHEIQKRFSDSFIFYRPRDIVSGDLYWFSRTKGKSIVAAIDCTGHGVPGAFMSIVANSSMNEIVNERGITNPSEILTALDEKVTNTLKQDAEGSDSRDGMDVSLCTFDLENNVLEYAGANRPLVIVKNGELTRIKGSSFPVGSYFDTSKVYENHTFEITSGDSIYIFSDGYPDQFGGPKGKKFMIKKFERLIMDIQKYKMSKQEELLEQALKDWQGDLESVDDILVIGVKV